MFDKILNHCREGCRKKPSRVAFASGPDGRVLRTARRLKQAGLADPILIGNKSELRDFAARAGVNLTGIKIRQPRHDPQFDHRVRALFDRRKSKGLVRSEAEALLSDPLWYGCDFLLRDQADLLMTGTRTAIKGVLQAALRVIGPQKEDVPVSGFYLLVSPDGERVLAFADCCVNPRPEPEQLAAIAVETSRAFRHMTGLEPKTALLSFSTLGSAQHDLAERVQAAVALVQKQKPGFTVEGEFQFDAAIVPQVAAKKAPHSSLQGEANVLIFPSLNAANIGYKIARDLAGWRTYGPFYTGFRKAVQGLPPAGDDETFLVTTLLACCLLERNGLNLSHS